MNEPFSWPNSSLSSSVSGQRRAGHLDEGLVAPRAVLVEGLGEELLARAALAEQQHGGGRGRHLADGLEDREHLRALAHQVVEAVLVLEPLAQERVSSSRRFFSSAFWSTTSSSSTSIGLPR